MPVARKEFLTRAPLAPPRRADQEAEAERQPDGCERALRDDVFQRFLDRVEAASCAASIMALPRSEMSSTAESTLARACL